MTPLRIAMWSGPRNISTAMMRSFGNRQDTGVVDEPFYAAYLAATGVDHPMRAEVLASQPTDPDAVIGALLGAAPGGRPVFYQKHMTHHMLPGFDLGWMADCRNVFLIRAPERVIASYTRARENPRLADLGFERQVELFARESDRLSQPPPVIDADDILADPAGMLRVLCDALDLPFSKNMLSWQAGPRATDGAWAPHWYEAVNRSTGFAPPPREPPPPAALADAARPFYLSLHTHRLRHEG